MRLPSEGVAIDVALIRAHGAGGRLTEALQVYEQASGTSLPDLGRDADARWGQARAVPEQLALLDAALFACARNGDARAALRLYRACVDERRSVQPDAHAVHSLLTAVAEASDAPNDRHEGFALLRQAARTGAADARGLALLLSACEKHSDGPLALQLHRWAEGAGLLETLVPAARAALLDSLFLSLTPPDEHASDFVEGSGVGGGGAVVSAVPSGAQEGHAERRAERLNARECLEAVRATYTAACHAGVPLDAGAAQASLVVLSARASDFAGAFTLLETAERHGYLVAPSEATQQRLLDAWRYGRPDDAVLDAAEGAAALELLEAFALQREDERWRMQTRERHSAVGTLARLLREHPHFGIGPRRHRRAPLRIEQPRPHELEPEMESRPPEIEPEMESALVKRLASPDALAVRAARRRQAAASAASASPPPPPPPPIEEQRRGRCEACCEVSGEHAMAERQSRTKNGHGATHGHANGHGATNGRAPKARLRSPAERRSDQPDERRAGSIGSEQQQMAVSSCTL